VREGADDVVRLGAADRGPDLVRWHGVSKLQTASSASIALQRDSAAALVPCGHHYHHHFLPLSLPQPTSAVAAPRRACLLADALFPRPLQRSIHFSGHRHSSPWARAVRHRGDCLDEWWDILDGCLYPK
jgi:hypothetical protein